MEFKGTEYHSGKELKIMNDIEKEEKTIKLKKFKKFDRKEISKKEVTNVNL